MIRHLQTILIACCIAVLFPVNIYCQGPLKILPLGNSITYGSREGSTGDPGYFVGYRYKLYQLMNQSGYYFDFIGHHSSGYSVFPDANNGGFSGIRDNELAQLLQTGIDPRQSTTITPGPYLNYISPDIILLHIGTNDIAGGQWTNPDPIGDILNTVDAYESYSGKPVLVLVAKIISNKATFGNCDQYANISDYNYQLATLVNSRISSGDKLILVDMQCGAGIHYNFDMADDLHPNSSGEDKMGIRWFEVIDNINSAPVVSDIPNQSKPEGQSFNTINLDNYVTDAEDTDADITWTTQPANPEFFNITINAQRVATITPKSGSWNGSETISFVATDKGKYGITRLGKSAQNAVTFTVTHVNKPPVITLPSNLVAYQGELYNEPILVYDPDSDPVTITPVILPEWLNLSANPGKLYGTPGYYHAGNSTIRISVTDNTFTIDTTFIITIIGTNNPPVIHSLPNTEADDYEYYYYRIDATDPDDDPITFVPVLIPEWTVFNSSTGELSGTPEYNHVGSHPVQLKVTDGKQDTIQSFTIIVTNRNDTPVITSTPGLIDTVGHSYSYILMATDADEDDVLTFNCLQKPSWLFFIPSQSSATLFGTPTSNDAGTHEIILTVTDSKVTVTQKFNLLVVNPTALNEIEELALQIYPVPVDNELNISYGKNDAQGMIELFDSQGRLQLKSKLIFSDGYSRIATENCYSGIYFFRISLHHATYSGKIIINRRL